MKTTWLNSLGVKILLAYVVGAVLSIVLIVAAAFAVIDSKGDLLSGFDVADTAREMSRELRFDERGLPVSIGSDPSARHHGLDIGHKNDLAGLFQSLKGEAAYRVLDQSGKEVLASATGVAFWPSASAAARLERGSFDFEHDGVAMRGATEPLIRDGKTWYVQFAVSKRFIYLMYDAFALPMAMAGVGLFSLVLLLVFGPCVYFTLRYALTPVRRISEAAAEISPRSLHARLLAPTAPSEIRPLVESFNRALDRLEQGYRVQQEFLATAAHELKTPLALVRAQVELGAPTEQRRMLLHDVDHMSRQVQQLLHLAEASEVQNYRPADIDMHEAVREAAVYLQRMADAAGVRLELPERNAEVRWRADRGALFTLLKNLLENAIQHTPAGTLVTVEVDSVSLTVRDWGEGVPHDQLTKIFTRFWRSEHRRDQGAGLGLTICQEIALAHGWTLRAHRADPGLRIVASRPRKPEPQEATASSAPVNEQN